MEFDYVLVGGGLQNGLIALGLRAARPEATIALVERAETLGGNHAWSFHESDVPEAARAFVMPLVTHRWPGYDVRFPDHARSLALPYATFSSPSLDAAVRAAFAVESARRSALLLGCEATSFDARSVTLSDGRRLEGKAVIVARGPELCADTAAAGFLKFYGIEFRLDTPADVTHPIVMDACCPQTDGFRFFYVLPYAPDVLLVEDNYFSDDARLDRPALREAVFAYARERGYAVREEGVLREEFGVLPLPYRGSPPSRGLPEPNSDEGVRTGASGDARGPLHAGYGGGWFHPGTSYSLPVAARLAAHVVATSPEALFGPGLDALADEQEAQANFARRLNWLLFRTTPTRNRWRVMSGFYRNLESTIRRFYALDLEAADRRRILARGAYYWSCAQLLPRAPRVFAP